MENEWNEVSEHENTERLKLISSQLMENISYCTVLRLCSKVMDVPRHQHVPHQYRTLGLMFGTHPAAD